MGLWAIPLRYKGKITSSIGGEISWLDKYKTFEPTPENIKKPHKKFSDVLKEKIDVLALNKNISESISHNAHIFSQSRHLQ